MGAEIPVQQPAAGTLNFCGQMRKSTDPATPVRKPGENSFFLETASGGRKRQKEILNSFFLDADSAEFILSFYALLQKA